MQRFEKPVTDLFEMQDELVARMAITLNAPLIAVEARRADRTPTPDSMDFCFRGMAWVNRGVTSEFVTCASSTRTSGKLLGHRDEGDAVRVEQLDQLGAWADFAIFHEMDSTGSRLIRGAGEGLGSLYRMLGRFGRPARRQCRAARLS